MKALLVGVVLGFWVASSMHKVEAQADLVAKVRCKKPVAAPRAYWTMPDDGLSLGCTVSFQEVR